MAIYWYWGEDEFAIVRAVATLRQQTLDPTWESFNYSKLLPDQPDAVLQALNQAMTPPFGTGQRLVWLANTNLGQKCPDDVLKELERTLPVIPDTSVLLLTSEAKPDGRLKSTKFLQKYAEIKEFSQIPPWKGDLLAQQVRQVARDVGVALTPAAVELLVESVGNQTRQLYTELEKLRIYGGEQHEPLDAPIVAALVTTSTQTSLQLVDAIRQGATAHALELVRDLLNRNEAPAAIVTTLIGQFRLRLWVKLMLELGERDERSIAQAAELSNPKRLYYLQQEVRPLSLHQWQASLPLLLELDYNLKRGGMEPVSALQTSVVELCQLFKRR